GREDAAHHALRRLPAATVGVRDGGCEAPPLRHGRCAGDRALRLDLPPRLRSGARSMTQAAAILRERLGTLSPRLALVLGSGLGGLAGRLESPVRIPYAELPGFPRSGVSGHAGELAAGMFEGTSVIMLAGRAHYYEHGNA